ncbi:hypothetical protein [Niallia sp. MER 6]|uniref:hypothetical protein n=1 Tax=Niallia sp. MER 6 TaxID=2939567 RepID=UPI002042679A|nr:hypothetical protein [Niallia sp. MER 6]MCM3031397.1 hypothetical protein [Niallia sp. MER 6]
MKLLLCKKCNHIFSLTLQERLCECKATKGRYIDEQNAVYSGKYAVPLGFTNTSLLSAIKNQPQSGSGELFTAFVIPRDCSTFLDEQDFYDKRNDQIQENQSTEQLKQEKIDRFNSLAGSAKTAGEDIDQLFDMINRKDE